MKLVRRSRRKNQLCTWILLTCVVCFSFSLLVLSPGGRSQPALLSHYIYSNSFRSLLSSRPGLAGAHPVRRSLTHSKPLIDFHERAPPILNEHGYFVARRKSPEQLTAFGAAEQGAGGVVRTAIDRSRDFGSKVGVVYDGGRPGNDLVDVLESKISRLPRTMESHELHLLDIDLEGDYLQIHHDPRRQYDPPPPPKKVVPPTIVIVTNRRSGSSFLGQLLNQNPRVFFHFEPLKVLERYPGVYPNQTVFLSLLLSCRFKQMPHLMEFYNRERLHRASSLALSSPPLCTVSGPVNSSSVRQCEKLHPSYSANVCNTQFNHTAAKLIRLYNISSLQELVTRDHLNLKIIHLVRDPRGILSSRARAESRPLELGKSLDGQAGYLCRRLRSNMKWAGTNPPWLKGRYRRVRYEDIAYDPEEWARKIYEFTGLGEVPSEVLSWIRTNTNLPTSGSSEGDAYSTSRNSRETAEAWRRNISLPITERIGEICEEALRLMNYQQVTSREELLDMRHSLVRPDS